MANDRMFNGHDLLSILNDIGSVPSGLISFDEMIKKIKSHAPNVEGLDNMIEKLDEIASGLLVVGGSRDENGLTRDEMMALLLYTTNFDIEPNFCSTLNLRLRRHRCLEEFVPYIWLLLNGLKKCPVFPKEVVYRGVNVEEEALHNFLDIYRLNVPLQWDCFTSAFAKLCTQEKFIDEEVLFDEPFKENRSRKRGVLFCIHLLPGTSRVVSRYSNHPNEQQILLPPNFKFEVVERLSSSGLHILQLQELASDQAVLDLVAEPFVPLSVEELIHRYRLLGSGASDTLEANDVVESVRYYKQLNWNRSSEAAQTFLGFCYEKGVVVEKDIAEAIRLYRLSAEQGNSIALNSLGACYASGKGISKDISEAVCCFRLAAEQGYDAAQYNLGMCYKNGSGVTKDMTEAVRWYRLSAEQGYAWSEYHLGLCYGRGEGIAKDVEEAARWWRLSAERGNAEAQFDLGSCYHNGEGVNEDMAEAVRLYRLSAEQGNARSQYALGLCFKKGMGVVRNMPEAARWYRLSAEQGNIRAQNSLGVCYKLGTGVIKSMEEAVGWFRLSAEQGSADAQYNLGQCYDDGEGVAKDMAEAVRWYQLSAQQGNSRAECNLGLCYYKSEGAARNIIEAVRWFRLSADRGNAESRYYLGVCYDSGDGVTKDMKAAALWYQLPAEQGHILAQYNLGMCFLRGEGVSKNMAEAVRWFRLSAEPGHDSQNSLAVCHSKDLGITKDMETVCWHRLSPQFGFVLSQYNLGLCYYKGFGVPRNCDVCLVSV